MDFTSILIALFASSLRTSPVECAPTCSSLPGGSEIVQISVVYRHGDRTPISEYPKSKYYDPSSWSKEWGQLTLKGMRQHLRFGRWLMKEYGPLGKKLILPVYNASEYQVVSTDVDRTIMSGLANSAGIYHPMDGQEIENNIEWQPIPIRAIPADEHDKIFAQFCPLVEETLHTLRKELFEELRQKDPKLFEYADEHSGYGMVKYPERMFWLYDTLVCENFTFNEIPKWAEPIFPQPLQSYDMEFFRQYGHTEKMKRLTGGPLLKTIVETMNNKTQGIGTVKMYSYSAHDANVFSILHALGIPPQEPPKYTSAVIFELYRSPEDIYHVRLLYRPGPDTEPTPLIVPGCGDSQFCLLKTFIEVTANVLPGDLQKECQAATPGFAMLAKNRADFLAKHVKPFLR